MAETKTERLRCAFRLPHKGNRQCNMTCAKGQNVCAQHMGMETRDSSKRDHSASPGMPEADESNGQNKKRTRVQCPVDGSHSVWSDKLSRHVAKCPALKQAKQAGNASWYSENINVEMPTACATSSTSKPEMDRQWWNSRIECIRNGSKEKYGDGYMERMHERYPLEQYHLDEMNNRMKELGDPKHAVQQSSLIGHVMKLLKQCNRNDDEQVVVVEFGCGRGELSRYLASCAIDKLLKQHTEESSQHIPRKLNFLLIDRSSSRMKFDSKIGKDYAEKLESLNEKGTTDSENTSSAKDSSPNSIPEPSVRRLKADIKDINLNLAIRSEFGFDETQKIVIIAISKHLCGAATDLSLKCLLNALQLPNYTFGGAVLAMCCRQVCSWSLLLAQSHTFLQSMNLDSPETFLAISKATSWAVCGKREDQTGDGSEHITGLPFDERERLGYWARCLIDESRVSALGDLGMNARVVRYVESTVSLENHCLLVTAK